MDGVVNVVVMYRLGSKGDPVSNSHCRTYRNVKHFSYCQDPGELEVIFDDDEQECIDMTHVRMVVLDYAVR